MIEENKIKIKDLDDINFSINSLDYIGCDIDDFIIQEASIFKTGRERDALRIDVSDGSNKACFRIRALNQNGEKILLDLSMSDRIIEVPLESFPNLPLGYFKK